MQKHRRSSIPSPTAARRRLVLLAVLLAVLFLLAFCFGRYRVSPGTVLKLLLNPIFHFTPDWTPQMETAVFRIRLPRIFLACLVGCCLSAAGCAYQTVFRNPMASPDILGASAGAGFGAALAILLGFSKAGVTAFAFLFGMLTVVLVAYTGIRAGGNRTVRMLLAGLLISSLFTAGTSFLKLVADPNDQLPAITYWLMGSLSGTKSEDAIFAMIPAVIGLLPLLLLRWRINLLALGEEEAAAMGADPVRLRLAVILCATLLTATAVAVSGMIGWIGLVIPHLCRKLVGNDTRFLLPAGALMGASFLLMADTLARSLAAAEIPVGILTAFVGAPFLISMLSGKENRL